MITCPKCKQPNPDGSQICGSCGAQLAEDQRAPIKVFWNKVPKNVLVRSSIAVMTVVVIILLAVVFTGGASKANYALYMKDAELFYTDFSEEGNWEVTTRLLETDYTDKELASLTQGIGEYVAFNEKGNRLFFPDKMDDNSGVTLYYRDVKNPEEPAVKIDSDVTSYTINNEGSRVIYLKGDEGILYVHNLEKKEKIATNVQEFYVSDNLKKVVYCNKDKTCYIWKEEDGSSEIVNGITNISYVSENLENIYYIKDQALYKYTDADKEKEKIASEIAALIRIYESGEIYYSKEEVRIINMMDYVNDDMAVSDAVVTKPDYPSYPDAPKYPYAWNYATTEEYHVAKEQYKADHAAYQAECERLSEAYQKAYEVYMKKVQRDNLRDMLANTVYEMKEYPLFYYNGKESILVNDSMKSASVSECALETAVCVFSKYDQSHIKRFRLSELNSASDVQNEVMRALTSSHIVQVAIGAECYEIEQENAEYFSISADGSEIYFLDKVDGEGKGDLYKFTVKKEKVSTPELVDDHVYKYNKGFVSEDYFTYYKDVDTDQVIGDLYVNGNKVGYEVYMYGLTCTDGVIMYYTDWNHDKAYGTLQMYNGKDTTKIADDVSAFHCLEKEKIMYLHDYSMKYFTGTLYLYKNGKAEKIDDDVIAIVTYGW